MAAVVVTLESVLTLQEKIDRSLQDADKTILGRMLDMFLFPSNKDNPVRMQLETNNHVVEDVESNDSVSPQEDDNNDVIPRSPVSDVADTTTATTKQVEGEFIEQYEPGVYIYLVYLPDGTTDLTKVRFSRRKFSEHQAERWWSENRERVYKRYNVVIITSPVSSATAGPSMSGEFVATSEMCSDSNSKEHPTRAEDVVDVDSVVTLQEKVNIENSVGVQMEINSHVAEAVESNDSLSPQEEENNNVKLRILVSEVSDTTTATTNQVVGEWVDQYEPGVYIYLVSLPDGTSDLKKVRFSRRIFSEHQAERWWSENREQVYKRYNVVVIPSPVYSATTTL
ncbi:hypothetical protein L1887_38810 [Cichorium endivia]|nr:hypothetical protein L1887_38810 [Cichorium endivia]